MNTEHWLKSKLAWPICPKSIKLKKKVIVGGGIVPGEGGMSK